MLSTHVSDIFLTFEYLPKKCIDGFVFFFPDIIYTGLQADLSVLQEAPFTDHGSIVEVFTDLSVWAGIRQVIERVNANAAA